MVGSYGLIGCGGAGASGAAATATYLGTQRPGDVWSWTLNADTFTATNSTLGYTYSGTKSTLSTGFLKLTITSTNDPGVTVGQSAYALEYPNTALIIKPMGADTRPPIFAGSLGSNPAGPTVTFNYVKVPKNGWLSTDEAYGYVTFNVSGNNYDGTTNTYDINGNFLGNNPSQFVGNNGEMTDLNPQGGIQTTGAMTPSGVCVLDYGPGNGGAIGVKQPAAPVDLTSLGTKSFRGYLVNQGKTQCVTVTPNGDGTLHGAGYQNPTGVETGTLDGGGGVTVTFTGQPAPGLVSIDIATSGGAEHIVAAISSVGGKFMIFGVGIDSGGSGYNVALAEN
ncbi:MAG: hypothetical protein JSS72_13535 [Armatimonadetes bacterium]|nr:hypothetical protein [Armatimonadota bacterium]